MDPFILLPLAVFAWFFASGQKRSSSPPMPAVRPRFIHIVTSSSTGMRLQYLDRDSEDPLIQSDVLRLVEGEGKYFALDQKVVKTERGSTIYTMVGGLSAPSDRRSLAGMVQLAAAGKNSFTLMKVSDAAAIASGNLPSQIELVVIVDPVPEERAIVAEGQNWFVYQMTRKS